MLERNNHKAAVLFMKLLSYLNLDSEVDDHDVIHQTIERDVIFRGTNLWILVFAILVASVGLNMNSTAVVIGAMLISPLMGPINGMGYSIATYDFQLFRKALKNLSFAVAASIVASTTYFLVTPISTAHSELLARTSPSIYDVLIAFFGGLAGIVAISSRQKGNVIPGVAIATALMPPLCTSGYGLATGQWSYFFGAFYLFTINTVFIALSAVIVSQLLRFPIRAEIEVRQRVNINRLISVIISAVLIPSIYFGYLLVKKEEFREHANRYVRSISVVDGNYLLNNEIDDRKRSIMLIYGGQDLSAEQKESIAARAQDFGLSNTEVHFGQGFSYPVNDLRAEINRLNLLLRDREDQLAAMQSRAEIGRSLSGELKVIFPQILSVVHAETLLFHSETGQEDAPVELVVLEVAAGALAAEDQHKITQWLEQRLGADNLRVFFKSNL